MAAFDITNADQVKLFNEFITPGVTSLFESESKIFGQIRKDWSKIDSTGKYAIQKISLRGSESYGASSTNDYPTATAGKFGESKVFMKRAEMFSLSFEGMTLEAAARKGAEADPLDFERDEQWKRIADDISRQLMGDGSARVALCNGAQGGGGSTTINCDHPWYDKATQFFEETEKLDVYTDADPGVREVNGIAVGSVTDKDTFEWATVQTWGDNSWICKKNVYVDDEAFGKGEMMGLMGIIRRTDPPRPNDSNGLQGLTVAAAPRWKAVVFDNPLGTGGTARDLTEDLLIQVLDEVESYGKVDVILVSRGVYRAYFALLKQYHMNTNEKKLWGGWSGLVFLHDGREIPVVKDKYVPDGHAMFVTNKALVLHVLTPNMIFWEKGLGGGGILQKVAGKNEYVAEGHMFMNLATNNRRAFGLLKDIKEPS